mgnify:FL=1
MIAIRTLVANVAPSNGFTLSDERDGSMTLRDARGHVLASYPASHAEMAYRTLDELNAS